MKRRVSRCIQAWGFGLVSVVAATLLTACSEPLDEAPPEEETRLEQPPPDEQIAALEDWEFGLPEERAGLPDWELAEHPVPVGLDEYRVVLGADPTLKIPGTPGELRVWIGAEGFSPSLPPGMVQDEERLPAVGQSATVEPFAPAFAVDPAATQCIRIHPTGSEVRFKLIPKERGTFRVGANIDLYRSVDCTGSPVPKTAAELRVNVEVDHLALVRARLMEVGQVSWEKVLEFWAALLGLVFALILFLLRQRLKAWFGFE